VPLLDVGCLPPLSPRMVLSDLSPWLSLVWPRIDALFVGGSTQWKLGPSAEALVAEAKARGKWVHMSRVNSARRIRYAASIGCDSIDGTKWVRWRDAYLDSGLDLAGGPQIAAAPADPAPEQAQPEPLLQPWGR
jgi:hypothetical protein